MLNKMKNYNQSNPFVVICKHSHDKLDRNFIKAIKDIIMALIINCVLVLPTIGLSIYYKALEGGMLMINLSFIFIIIFYGFMLYKLILTDKSIKDIDDIINADFSEINVMNNESIMNAITKINILNGRAEFIHETMIYITTLHAIMLFTTFLVL